MKAVKKLSSINGGKGFVVCFLCFSLFFRFSIYNRLRISKNEILDCLDENDVIGRGGSRKVYKATCLLGIFLEI